MMEGRLFSLRARVFFSASILVLVATILLTAVFGNLLRNDYIDQFQRDLARISQFQGERTAQTIESLRQDTLTIAATPPIFGVMQAYYEGGANLYQDDALDIWQYRMAQIFTAFVKSRTDYQQIRFIGVADGGRELVRVNRNADSAVIVTADKLQQKARRDYFKATLALKPGEVYLSEINLNREFGKVEQPYRPTLRAATPVFNAAGDLFGMIVINMDATRILHQTNAIIPDQVQFYIANTEGYWLSHPDASREFGFDLGQRFRWQDEFPELMSEQPDSTLQSPHLVKVNSAPGARFVMEQSFSFDPLVPSRKLRLFYAMPEAVLNARIWPLTKALIVSSLVVGLLILLLTLFTVDRVLAPLTQLHAAANDLADGHYDTHLPSTGPLEVNTLTKAFEVMRERIRQREKDFRQLNQELELRVKARTAEMTSARNEAESATAAKSEFLANMSHEIRTPLNAILGIAYVLEKQSLSDEAHGLVQRICVAARSLSRVINDILDFSKIEAGHLDIESAPFQLAAVLDNLAAIMASSARDKDIELIIAPPPLVLAGLKGDALRLEQVLVNLTSNAIKFTHQGQVRVNIKCLSQGRNGVRLRFEVSDTGIGIAPEKIQEIFAPFAQADASTTRRFGGTGLGLSICRHLVQLMGGEMVATSEPGVGSQFSFELNLEWSPESVLSHPEMAQLSVLIAAAPGDVQDALQATVAALGWLPVLVTSGAEAEQQALQQQQAGNPFDVIILDWQLADAEGLANARQLHSVLQPDPAPIFLMVSSYSRGNPELQFGHPSLEAVLTKPLSTSVLYDAVTLALSKRDGGVHIPPVRPTVLGQRLAGLTLLVVDDSDINRDVAERIFSLEGANVVLANNGQQALAWLNEHHAEVDVVLMDIQMPVMDGYEATRVIRRSPTLKALPVIALTAGAFKSQQEAAFAAGMNDFISKPFDVDVAIALIQRLAGLPADHGTPVVPQDRLNTPSDNLMRYPGINISRGLEVWRDVERYQQYLRKFARDYADCVRQMQETDAHEGARIAHKLRGAAGSLALEEIAKLAQEIEHMLGERGAAVEPLAALQTALAVTLNSINRYAPPVSNLVDDLNNAEATALPGLMHQCLLAFDSDNPALIEPLLSKLCEQLLPNQVQPLLKALEDFDFRAGESATVALAHSLGIPLEQKSHAASPHTDRG